MEPAGWQSPRGFATIRVCVNDDAAVLLPAPRALNAIRVAGMRKNLAAPNPEPPAPNQYTLKYRSSSHSLTFPMYSIRAFVRVLVKRARS